MNDAPMQFTYVTSLEEISWGIVLMSVTMLMHGFGMLLTLRITGGLHVRLERANRQTSFTSGVAILVVASWCILLVHLIEVAVWALFFQWQGALNNLSTAYYFSLMDYTTVGSEYDLPSRWRLLGGMIAIAGLLTFAWSTGVFLILARRFQEQQMQILESRSRARRDAKLHEGAK